jgi:chromate transporter
MAIALLSAALALWMAGPSGMAAAAHAAAVRPASVGVAALFLSGLKAGLLTFGGAYTAIPFVRHDAVGRGWLSEGQFLDSLALGGIIPAPLIIFATFVGYLAGGLGGALAMTAGIFLPAFSFGLLFYDRLERVIEDERLHRLLEGVAAGVVGLIAVTAIQLGWNVARALPSLGLGVTIFALSLAVLYVWKSKLNVLAVVVGAALLGTLF